MSSRPSCRLLIMVALHISDCLPVVIHNGDASIFPGAVCGHHHSHVYVVSFFLQCLVILLDPQWCLHVATWCHSRATRDMKRISVPMSRSKLTSAMFCPSISRHVSIPSSYSHHLASDSVSLCHKMLALSRATLMQSTPDDNRPVVRKLKYMDPIFKRRNYPYSYKVCILESGSHRAVSGSHYLSSGNRVHTAVVTFGGCSSQSYPFG